VVERCVRGELRRLAARAAVRRRFAPHQLRHAHALELAGEGVPLNIIQRQLATPTSARRRSTSRESTPRRSSPLSGRGAPR
jgi:integrase